ncbi:MAG: response regulator receiver protein [Sporomusa sp.]|jgi:FixJ family two-component response regulator|nr:response regulator receiver protein [Sporomusa sp.]
MRKNVILFVDDEVNILSALRRVVIDQEFEALFANSAQQALAIMKDKPVNVLVTDMRMPQMDGLAMLKIVKQEHPEIVRIVLSGYTQLAQVLATINHGDIFKFITKPWEEEDLLTVLYQAIEYYNLRQDKKELELMLHKRNMAYKKMLASMEQKFSSKRQDLDQIKKFCSNVSGYIANEENLSVTSIQDQLKIFQQLIDNYIDSMPTVLTDFLTGDFLESIKKQILSLGGCQFHVVDQTISSVACRGNTKLVLLILNNFVTFLNSAGTDRNFRCTLSSQSYPNKSTINITFEIGYVDGVDTLINKDEVLTKDKIEMFCKLVNFLGNPYDITTTLTCFNRNASIVTLIASFPCENS